MKDNARTNRARLKLSALLLSALVTWTAASVSVAQEQVAPQRLQPGTYHPNPSADFDTERVKAEIKTGALLAGSRDSAQQPDNLFYKHVSMAGNSIAHFQATFGTLEFPEIAPGYTYIWGNDSFTCADVLVLILYQVPADTDIVILIDSSNDIRTGVPVDQHMACIEQTISVLQNRNPDLKVVLANTPSWTHFNPCTNEYNDPSIAQLIEAYNAAYAQNQWSSNVKVADVWTPMTGSDGWAIPVLESGPCGVHPGQEFVWGPSWAHFAAPYEALVSSTLQGQW